MLPRRRAAAIATAFAVASTGLLTGTTTTAAHAAVPARNVNVFVAANHSIAMPGLIRPGMHKFTVTSARAADFQLLKPEAGYTRQEAARDINRAIIGGRIPALRRFEAHVSLAGGASTEAGGSTVFWAKLNRGPIWALDTSSRRAFAKNIFQFGVGGEQVPGGARGTSVIRAVGKADWAPRPKVINERGRLTFRNNSSAPHFLAMPQLLPGKTARDVRRWIRSGGEGALPFYENRGLDTGVVSPGRQMVLPYNLPRGNYTLLCFWPDAEMNGVPHAFLGMWRIIKLR